MAGVDSGAPTDARVVRRLGSAGPAFFGSFSRLQEIQRQAIRLVLEGRDVLVASATASGKTEAVIAPLVARLRARAVSTSGVVRLLVIAPTRALVNDLAERIETPLSRMGLACGRQTSDKRDKTARPFALVTTPESLDSMIVRDGLTEAGRPVGHLLGGVCAAFVDEAHVFDGTARGDHVCWLLARLRRLKNLAAKTGARDGGLQVCAASATVSAPEALAARLLGGGAVALRVPGARDIEMLGPSTDPAWLTLGPEVDVPWVKERLEPVPPDDFAAGVESRLWQAISGAKPMRKVLVFVPTRNLCDTLAAELSRRIPRRRNAAVFAHHGSLDRIRREEAEQRFSSARDAVMVATTTLEVGVDIGDVDLVALVGAPPGTRSLLQRIGRGGRCVGRTRVLALPRDERERCAFASMLLSARDGALEPEIYAHRWSVFVQQCASAVAQTGPRGRRRADLISLAEAVRPGEGAARAVEILDELVDRGLLEDDGQRLCLGEAWADAFDGSAGGMHANLESAAAGLPVIDAGTGAVIARVAERPAGDSRLALGGEVWSARVVDGEILLTANPTGRPREGFRYATRGAPTGLEFAVHVRRGLGFGDSDAPLVVRNGSTFWMHFGGSAYQCILTALLPSLRGVRALAGLGVAGAPLPGQLDALAASRDEVQRQVAAGFESLEPALATGPYQRELPEGVRRRVVSELFGVDHFRAWLKSRRVWEVGADDPRFEALRSLLGGQD